MDESTINKFQHQFWVTKQTVYRRLGKKEDEHIVASDSTLDAKLELFKSIQQTSSAMNKLLDRYQERICYLAQEQNTMGRFLKEHGKVDKSGAGKMMIQMGKSLIYCSQQEIALRPSLLRLYQEVETFRNRAIEDTLVTVKRMERVRTEYRATLNWMKNVSQELDPDTYKQMEKFRKVQTHVKMSKAQFDKLKLACLQKVDLLAAARCNMFSHALIQYQISSSRTTENIARVFNTLATSFKGYQHYEFSVIKDLAEPSKQLALRDASSASGDGRGRSEEPKDRDDDMLLDIGEHSERKSKPNTKQEESDEDLLAIGDLRNHDAKGTTGRNQQQARSLLDEDLISSKNASDLLDNLLGPLDLSPDTEAAQEALDLTLAWPSPQSANDKSKESTATGAGAQPSSSLVGAFRAPSSSGKESDRSLNDLLSNDFESLNLEGDGANDTVALLQELLTSSNNLLTPQPAGSPSAMNDLSGIPFGNGQSFDQGQPAKPATAGSVNQATASKAFLPSQLLNLDSLDTSNDLLNFGAPLLQPMSSSSKSKSGKKSAAGAGATTAGGGDAANKAWYDIFADLDPLENPDAAGKKEDEIPSRLC